MRDRNKQNCRIPITSTPNYHAQRTANASENLLNLYKTTILSPVGKQCRCFQNYGKTDQAIRSIKSGIINIVIDYVLFIDQFEQKCALLKGMLQSLILKYHVKTIGVDR